MTLISDWDKVHKPFANLALSLTSSFDSTDLISRAMKQCDGHLVDSCYIYQSSLAHTLRIVWRKLLKPAIVNVIPHVHLRPD